MAKERPGEIMISKSKERVMISIEKTVLAAARAAASEWDLTLSEYIQSLIRADQIIGPTGLARCMKSEKERRNSYEGSD